MRMGCCGDAEGKRQGCADAKRFAEERRGGAPPKAVLACDGACIKGEVPRVAANVLTHRLERERSVRVCHGDALTAEDSGMLALMKRAPEVIAIEGCSLRCASVLLARRAPELRPTVIDAQRLYTYDRKRYFEILDMPRAELDARAEAVAEAVRERCFGAAP